MLHTADERLITMLHNNERQRMTEYEIYELIIELETRVGEQGQYFVTGLFAFVLVIYLFGQKMTRGMITITSAVYSAYAFLNIFAVYSAMQRIVILQSTWPSPTGLPPAPASTPYLLSLFWMLAWVSSMFFMVLVLKRKIETPDT